MLPSLSDSALQAVMQEIVEEKSTIDVHVICERLQVDARSLLNQISIAAAQSFISNARDFEFCDDVMNSLFSAIVDLSMHEPMPEPAFSIYLAFDAGEYRRSGDPSDVYPWEKYTRPEVERILQALRNGLPAGSGGLDSPGR